MIFVRKKWDVRNPLVSFRARNPKNREIDMFTQINHGELLNQLFPLGGPPKTSHLTIALRTLVKGHSSKLLGLYSTSGNEVYECGWLIFTWKLRFWRGKDQVLVLHCWWPSWCKLKSVVSWASSNIWPWLIDHGVYGTETNEHINKFSLNLCKRKKSLLCGEYTWLSHYNGQSWILSQFQAWENLLSHYTWKK